MIRTTASVRKASAVAGVAGILLLAGCSGAADAEDTTPKDGGDSADTSTGTGSGDYADGTYTANGAYQTPETLETIMVTVTLEDQVVTDVKVKGEPLAPETENFQGQFIDGIADEVVGKNLDDIKVDRVAGSSLTSGGFNQAIESIKEQASA